MNARSTRNRFARTVGEEEEEEAEAALSQAAGAQWMRPPPIFRWVDGTRTIPEKNFLKPPDGPGRLTL